jgi:glycosyltransferase involved in cell wall biosynthesis
MKILVITTSYPVKRDGSEAAGSYVEDFVKTLSKEVDVAVVYPVSESISQEQDDGVIHCPFCVPHLPLSLLNPANPLHWSKIISTIRSGQSTVNKAVLDFKPDHILALWTLPSGYWAKSIYNSYGIPYSIWALGSDIWTLGKVPIIKSVLKNVLQNAQFCFADGYQLRDDVIRISGREAHFMPSTRILPLSKTKKLKKSGPYNLAFLGRWHQNKGIDLLLDALELLDDSDWEKIKCIRIAGGGPLESVVKTKIRILQDIMHRPIKLSGFLDTNTATEFLFTADYLIIPSRIESIPVIFSDAMQSLCPVITTPVGDLPILMTRFNVGCLASEISSKALKNAIKTALNTSPDNFLSGIKAASSNFKMKTVVTTYVGYLSDQ